MLKEIIAKYDMRKRIHLRHLLNIGISIEEQGKTFYNSLAEKATNQNVKALCSRLAQEELAHKKLLEEAVSRWVPFPIDKQRLAVIEQELKIKDIFFTPPPIDSIEKDLIKYAIGIEKKMADFYLSFEKNFPETWKKLHIHRLVDEEKRHEGQLAASLDN
jgi:rubrerythrin